MANGLSFFITVAKPLEHIIATPIEGRDIASLRKVVRHHLTCYSQRRIIYSDNERGLAALAPELAAMGIQLIHSGPGMHVHVVERAGTLRRESEAFMPASHTLALEHSSDSSSRLSHSA